MEKPEQNNPETPTGHPLDQYKEALMSFARKYPVFTTSELRDHFTKEGVEVPKSPTAFRALFASLREHTAETAGEEVLVWRSVGEKGLTLYALIEPADQLEPPRSQEEIIALVAASLESLYVSEPYLPYYRLEFYLKGVLMVQADPAEVINALVEDGFLEKKAKQYVLTGRGTKPKTRLVPRVLPPRDPQEQVLPSEVDLTSGYLTRIPIMTGGAVSHASMGLGPVPELENLVLEEALLWSDQAMVEREQNIATAIVHRLSWATARTQGVPMDALVAYVATPPFNFLEGEVLDVITRLCNRGLLLCAVAEPPRLLLASELPAEHIVAGLRFDFTPPNSKDYPFSG